jgi:hypothetical protein
LRWGEKEKARVEMSKRNGGRVRVKMNKRDGVKRRIDSETEQHEITQRYVDTHIHLLKGPLVLFIATP